MERASLGSCGLSPSWRLMYKGPCQNAVDDDKAIIRRHTNPLIETLSSLIRGLCADLHRRKKTRVSS
ncbi:hypothetical protein PHYPO_G00063430 [Pangasianodon hypophthalmus]|uniref:Uncharacterized protein n=1 Tax=Pangasianodon hypophthalmus TaxID=310915 RepID=A0A5N5M254_PANHP|nr:hypothetical protein PHYPO_G00063430 [Pangasianodon hypophthalmus]